MDYCVSLNEIFPDFNDPILEFYNIEDFPIAYYPKNNVAYDVLFNKILKLRTDYPNTEYLIKYRYINNHSRITKEKAIIMAEEIEALNSLIEEILVISEDALRSWIPPFNHPRLRFIEVEDKPIAYFPKKYLYWRVLHGEKLKIYKGYPDSVDIHYNGCRITREEALILAEYWDAKKI